MDANTREKKNRAHTNQQNEVKKKYDRNNKIFQPTEPFFPRLVTVFLISSLFFSYIRMQKHQLWVRQCLALIDFQLSGQLISVCLLNECI